MRLIDADELVKCVNKIFRLKPDARWSHRAVLNTIDAAPTISGWISVEDDLPKEHDSMFANCKHLRHMWTKESDKVIVYVRLPDGTGTSTEGRLQDGKWWTRVSPMLEPVVTHWMPFPEPPRDEE